VVKIANSNVKNRFRKCYQNIWYDIKKCNSFSCHMVEIQK
jgi:hypothetical protein